MADLEELRARLEAIGEDLADAAMEALREALEAGHPEGGKGRRPDTERRLTQARRAVERAIAALEGIHTPGGIHAPDGMDGVDGIEGRDGRGDRDDGEARRPAPN